MNVSVIELATVDVTPTELDVSDPVLTLELSGPPGIQGPTGEQGEPGAQGATGAPGDSVVHLYDTELGSLPTRLQVPTGVTAGQATVGTDFRLTIAVGGDCYFDIPLTSAEIAATNVYAELRIDR